MKVTQITALLSTLIVLSNCEPTTSKRPLIFTNWPPKYSKQQMISHVGRNPGQRTLVVQIHSDGRVPFVLKRNPHHQAIMSRPMRPHKMAMSPQVLIKPIHISKLALRKQPSNFLKLKYPGSKPNHYEKPSSYHYEKPFSPTAVEIQKLPIDTPMQFNNNMNNFVPIHTIPAPNLGTSSNSFFNDDNHISPEAFNYNPHQYQVTEEHNTNDQTLVDPFSGQQKYFAPDPDPSLPTAKIRPAFEPHNTPSNGKPLPSDVQHNYLQSAPQSLQLIGLSSQNIQQAHELPFSVQSQQPQLQQYISQQQAIDPRAPLSVYNPTYLVTQSNQLYNQHQQQQQQLFKPNLGFLGSEYADTDLTQEIASNGQILQAAKDHSNVIHPQYVQQQSTEESNQNEPSFAALIASPSVSTADFAGFKLNNNGVEGGFVVSNYFNNLQHPPPQIHSVQSNENDILQKYIEAQRQQDQLLAIEEQQQASYEQASIEQAHQEQQQQQQQLQQQQQQQLQQHQQQQQQLQQQIFEQQASTQAYITPQTPSPSPSSIAPTSAYEQHKRLLEQHLGPSPLRIFVPDDDKAIQKRSDDYKEDSVEDAQMNDEESNESESFSVSSSVEVSNEDINRQ